MRKKSLNIPFIFIFLFISFLSSSLTCASASTDSEQTLLFQSKLKNSLFMNLGIAFTGNYVYEVKSTPEMNQAQYTGIDFSRRTGLRGASLGFGKEWNINGFFSTTSQIKGDYLYNDYSHQVKNKGIKMSNEKSYFTQSLNLNTEALDLIFQPFLEVGYGMDLSQINTSSDNKYDFKSKTSSQFLVYGLGLNVINEKGVYSFFKINVEEHQMKKNKTSITDNDATRKTTHSNKSDFSLNNDKYKTVLGSVGFGVRF